MENNPSRNDSHERPSLLMVALILLFPVAFAFLSFGLTYLGETLHLFYGFSNTLILTALGAFPLTWIYLFMRWANKKKANTFSKITTGLTLPLLLTSAVMTSLPVYPLMDIERAFNVPDDSWEKHTEGNGHHLAAGADIFGCSFLTRECPEVYRTWTKHNYQLTVEDLQSVAKANGFKDFIVTSEECEKPEPDNDGCALAGEVDGAKVRLSYYNTHSGNSELRLELHGPDGDPYW